MWFSDRKLQGGCQVIEGENVAQVETIMISAESDEVVSFVSPFCSSVRFEERSVAEMNIEGMTLDVEEEEHP